MATLTFSRLATFLGKDGMIPATAVMSIITTSNTAQDILEYPLSSTFWGLIFGGIGGGIIESLAPLPARPVISGCIILATGANIFGRTMGWIQPPSEGISISVNPENK
ncbi:Hypothetical protein HVR_LOCUS118 [uncultured virus]|nr:Hypothetical protein HVR_LOCUS118 [uncultured virus]